MFDTVLKNIWVRALGALLLLLVFLGAVYLLLPILTSLFFSFLVAYILSPVVDMGQRWHIPRMVTICVLLTALLICTIVLPVYLALDVLQEADQLIVSASTAITDERFDMLLKHLPLREVVVYMDWMPEGAKAFDEQAVFLEHVVEGIRDHIRQLMGNFGGHIADTGKEVTHSLAQALTSISNWARSAISFFVNLSLFAFVAAYLLRDYDALIAGMRDLVPPRHRPWLDDIMHKIDLQMRSFLRGQIAICTTLAVLYGIGLYLAGAPFAVPIAVVGGAASIVPYVGPFLTLMPALVTTALAYGLGINLVFVLAVFLIVQVIESYFLTPRVLGSHIGLNPVWVIVALMVFSTTFGFIGVVIAVPTAAVLKVLVLEGHDRYRRSRFYTESVPVPSFSGGNPVSVSSLSSDSSSSSGSSGIDAS